MPAGLLWWLPLAVIAAALVLAPRFHVTGPSPASSRFGAIVHWRDAGHDWLLVADRSAHELVVYDALSGRPLRRIGADQGVRRLRALALHGNRLLVKGGPVDDDRVLSLPELQPQVIASR